MGLLNDNFGEDALLNAVVRDHIQGLETVKGGCAFGADLCIEGLFDYKAAGLEAFEAQEVLTVQGDVKSLPNLKSGHEIVISRPFSAMDTKFEADRIGFYHSDIYWFKNCEMVGETISICGTVPRFQGCKIRTKILEIWNHNIFGRISLVCDHFTKPYYDKLPAHSRGMGGFNSLEEIEKGFHNATIDPVVDLSNYVNVEAIINAFELQGAEFQQLKLRNSDFEAIIFNNGDGKYATYFCENIH